MNIFFGQPGVGLSPAGEDGEVRYQLNFPLDFSPEKQFDIVLKWVPRDEVWVSPEKHFNRGTCCSR